VAEFNDPKVRYCALCDTRMEHATGIGGYCPNPKCTNNDGPARGDSNAPTAPQGPAEASEAVPILPRNNLLGLSEARDRAPGEAPPSPLDLAIHEGIEALDWALDIIRITDQRMEQVDPTYKLLDRRADERAKLRAQEALEGLRALAALPLGAPGTVEGGGVCHKCQAVRWPSLTKQGLWKCCCIGVYHIPSAKKYVEGVEPSATPRDAKRVEDPLVRDGLYQEWLERMDWEHDDSIESAFLGGLDAALKAERSEAPEPKAEGSNPLPPLMTHVAADRDMAHPTPSEDLEAVRNLRLCARHTVESWRAWETSKSGNEAMRAMERHRHEIGVLRNTMEYNEEALNLLLARPSPPVKGAP
jgi:hypothetical protein